MELNTRNFKPGKELATGDCETAGKPDKPAAVSPLLAEWKRVRRKLLLIYKDMVDNIGWNRSRSALDVMLYLHLIKNNATPSEIADFLYLPRQTMTSIIDSIEKKGDVKCIPDPGDRRSKRVVLELQGRRRIKEFEMHIRSHESAAVAKVGSDKVMKMLETMNKLCDALAESSDAGKVMGTAVRSKSGGKAKRM